jgi:hypothetical protein
VLALFLSVCHVLSAPAQACFRKSTRPHALADSTPTLAPETILKYATRECGLRSGSRVFFGAEPSTAPGFSDQLFDGASQFVNPWPPPAPPSRARFNVALRRWLHARSGVWLLRPARTRRRRAANRHDHAKRNKERQWNAWMVLPGVAR